MDEQILNEIAQFLIEWDHYAITGHSAPDGDSIGSMLAMYHGLKNSGKNVVMIMEDSLPPEYQYLPCSSEIITPNQCPFDPQNAIYLDCADLSRAGQKVLECLNSAVFMVNIDHHADNSLFAPINFVDPQASATAEILYRLLTKMHVPITPEIADCLYAGIIMDSGGFLNSNTTGKTLRTAAMLLETGADVNKARNNLYESKTPTEMRLLQLALQNLQFNANGKIAWMVLPYEDIERLGALDVSTEGIINYTRSIQGVEVGLLFRETAPGIVKIGFRAKNDVDVSRIARAFGGGGHIRAAGARQNGDLDDVIKNVICSVEEVV